MIFAIKPLFSFFSLRSVAMARRSILLSLSLWVAVSPAMAVNIYDVVQFSRAGYGDDEIIAIIETAESVFELTSEDIAGLENLGISPQVINTMMIRTASNDQFDSAPTIELSGSSPEPATVSGSGTYSATTGVVPAPFSITVIREEGAGGHHHFTVDLYGAQLLVLRDEGRYRSTEDRAVAVAQRLDEASRLRPDDFDESHE